MWCPYKEGELRPGRGGEVWFSEIVLNFHTRVTKEMKVFLTEELMWRENDAFEKEIKMLVKTAFLPRYLPISISNYILRVDPEIRDPFSEPWKE